MTITIEAAFVFWVVVSIPPFLMINALWQSDRKDPLGLLTGVVFWAVFLAMMYVVCSLPPLWELLLG